MMYIAVIFLIVSVSALPESQRISIDVRDERSINSNIMDAIDNFRYSLKDAGLDPLHIERYAYGYELPVPVIFKAAAFVEELLSTGMSNITVNSIRFSLIGSRLNFDIELPFIDCSVGAAKAESTLFGNTFKMESSGKVEIHRMRFVGQMRVKIGLVPKVTVTVQSLKVNFTLDSINPDVNLVVQDIDYSNDLNNFLNTTVPNTFKEYESEINELLEIVGLDVMNQYIQQNFNLV